MLENAELMPQGAAARHDALAALEEAEVKKKMTKQMSMGTLPGTPSLVVPTPAEKQRKSLGALPSREDVRHVYGLIIDLPLLFRVSARKTTQYSLSLSFFLFLSFFPSLFFFLSLSSSLKCIFIFLSIVGEEKQIRTEKG